MSLLERKLEWLVWSGLLIAMLGILTVFVVLPSRPKPLPVLGALPDFSLTDQNNQNLTLASLRGQVWIADVIFTRCAGQCPVMSAHMKKIQDALPAGTNIKLVSFTTDPAFDTPAVLKSYAARFGAREGEWTFLTGTKDALRHATAEGLKLGATEKPAGDRADAYDLFIHSQKMVVIDQQGQIRGYFDGETDEGPTQALSAARSLVRP